MTKHNDWKSTQFWFSVMVLVSAVWLCAKGPVNGNQFMWIIILAGILYGGRRIVQALVEAVKAKSAILTGADT